MPPTFSTDPTLVQAIMAGGRGAIFDAKEGVEDNYEEGARSIMRVRPTKRDIVIGVSASGMTQFVRGALTRARRAGARIIFVTCDPGTELQTFVDLTISPGVGAEVIAGSTRLKAGTATKMVLNMLTTGAMVRIGKTYGNLMVDVQTGSEKLKDRARRIVNIVTGLEYDDADKLLKKAHWNVKAAIVMQKTGLPYPKALVAPAQGARFDARGDRRRHRAAAARHAAGRRRSVDQRPQLTDESNVEADLQVGLISAAASRSSSRSTSGCTCSSDAGTRVVIGPFTVWRMHSAFFSPVATSTIRRALRIVPIPIDSASAGTREGSSPKSAALSRRVDSISLTRCVRASSSSPGSLKPMWPLLPMPSSCRSIPPAPAIAASYRSHSASRSDAAPLRK